MNLSLQNNKNPHLSELFNKVGHIGFELGIVYREIMTNKKIGIDVVMNYKIVF